MKEIVEIIIEIFKFIIKIIKDRKGVILEFQDPEWFEFRGGSYSNFVPSHIQTWVKIYITNTTSENKILESIEYKMSLNTTNTLVWKLENGGIYKKLDVYQTVKNFLNLPLSIPPKQSIPAYVLFIFKINHNNPEEFIKELRTLPEEFLIKINYRTKGYKNKNLERKFNFKDEYKKIYEEFLNSFYQGQIINNNDPNEILRKKLLEKLKNI